MTDRITPGEATRILGISISRLMQLIREGRLVGEKNIYGHREFERKDVETLQQERERAAKERK
jgi:hypothetical protein